MHKKMTLIVFLLLLLIVSLTKETSLAATEEPTLIIEVSGDPHIHKQHIEANYPFVKVIALYDTLFQGLALQAKEKHLQQVQDLSFVKEVHPVYTYSTDVKAISKRSYKPKKSATHLTNFPQVVNDSAYTGKDIKIGVVDTGIDYNHPSLAKNYAGGYDVVDFDDDPLETLPTDGMPTIHGTHVAGIIAADGDLQGVASDANIYAYRALGPGGRGTSIQVIAALEQAFKDGMDIINLSLGNSINGPDVPTSTAVNRAYELGVLVVVANGNDGPEDWTVGSPATATKAISVGALAPGKSIYVLNDLGETIEIPLTALPGSQPWTLERSFEVVTISEIDKSLHGKALFVPDFTDSIAEMAEEADRSGAIALFIEPTAEFLPIIDSEEQLPIPIILVSQEVGERLKEQLKNGSFIAKATMKEIASTIAPFSSRGPVTVDWAIKPDILAPGTNIISTVPGGYLELQGTSMAAPHVAGGLALIKEAQPTWTNDQIIGALKTTAKPVIDNLGEYLAPTVQGVGTIQVNAAIQTDTIIYDPILSFGKVNGRQQTLVTHLTIENISDLAQTYSFNIPKQTAGYKWELPQTFTLDPAEKIDIPIHLSVHPLFLETGIHQGYLALQQGEQTYELPYLFIYDHVDYPLVMGFGVGLKPFTTDEFMYQFYLAEQMEALQIDLFDPDSLTYVQTLLTLDDLPAGLNKGELDQMNLPNSGHYIAKITVEQKDNRQTIYEQELWIE